MGSFKLRGFKYRFLLLSQILNRKIRLGPVNAGLHVPVGRYPHAPAAAGRAFETIDSQKCIDQRFGYRDNFAIFKKNIKRLPVLVEAWHKFMRIHGLINIDPKIGTERGGQAGNFAQVFVIQIHQYRQDRNPNIELAASFDALHNRLPVAGATKSVLSLLIRKIDGKFHIAEIFQFIIRGYRQGVAVGSQCEAKFSGVQIFNNIGIVRVQAIFTGAKTNGINRDAVAYGLNIHEI